MMTNNNLVSIIIPTYNRSHMIKRTLLSCIKQTYRPLEIIVVDDGSTDDTETIVRGLFERNERSGITCRYEYQENNGAPSARNKGFSISQGEFVQWIDSDDTMSPIKISSQMDCLLTNDEIDVAYCRWRIKCIYPWGEIPGPLHQKEPMASEDEMLRGYISSRWFCPSHAYLYKRSVIEKTGGWDESLKRRQDTDFLIRVLMEGNRFCHVKGGVVYYHRHKGDRIGHASRFESHFDSLLRVIKKACATLRSDGRYSQYRDDIQQYLVVLGREVRRSGYLQGDEQVKALYEEMLNSSWEDDQIENSGPSDKGIYSFYKTIHNIIGDCGADWLKKAVGRLEYP